MFLPTPENFQKKTFRIIFFLKIKEKKARENVSVISKTDYILLH